MSDEPPGFNAPRRKARFRSGYDDSGYRRPSVPRPGSAEQPTETETTSDAEYDPATTPGEGAGESAEANQPFGSGPMATTAENAEGEENDLLPNFRLNKVYEERPPQKNPLKDWRWLLLTFLLAALGVGGGYTLARMNAPAILPPTPGSVRQPAKLSVDPLSPQVQSQVDAAFESIKKGQYQAGRDQFNALHNQHPEWWSMSIEAARSSLYLHDALEAQRALHPLSADQGLPDADFIMGLLHLTNKELNLAEGSFASAVARDPARPDFYYFWGECLRRDGKPLEAANRFRSALFRNQYENAEGLYQLKLWLSEIQADQEEASGTDKDINTALALPRPPYEALFAAAARELKAKHPKEAAGFITRTQAITEPAVFRVIMQDPTFLEEANEPALASFYK